MLEYNRFGTTMIQRKHRLGIKIRRVFQVQPTGYCAKYSRCTGPTFFEVDVDDHGPFQDHSLNVGIVEGEVMEPNFTNLFPSPS